MCKIIFVTGGICSGKSDFAENIAKQHDSITYIALSEKRDEDKNWQNKINKHKSKRPENWKLIESDDLLKVLTKVEDNLLIDSIGGFVVKLINENDDEWRRNLDILIQIFLSYKHYVIIVGEQVGWGLVSEYQIGNRFAERMGQVLKEITNIATENWLTINGKAIRLDEIFTSKHI